MILSKNDSVKKKQKIRKKQSCLQNSPAIKPDHKKKARLVFYHNICILSPNKQTGQFCQSGFNK